MDSYLTSQSNLSTFLLILGNFVIMSGGTKLFQSFEQRDPSLMTERTFRSYSLIPFLQMVNSCSIHLMFKYTH